MTQYKVKKASKTRPRSSTKRKPRRKSPLASPELRWMDRFLKSFQEVADEQWIPAHYVHAIQREWKAKPTLH